MNAVKIYFDGGSRGNPGPAAGAAFADYETGHEKAHRLNGIGENGLRQLLAPHPSS